MITFCFFGRKMRYLVIIMLLPSLLFSLPAFAVTKKDMLGTWECTTKDPDGLSETTTLDTMNADGSMYQFWEIIHYSAEDKNKVSMIETFNIQNRWDLKKNKQIIKDWQLLDYQVYASDKRPIYDDELVNLLKQSWMETYKQDYDDKVYMAKDKRSFYYEPIDGVIVSRCHKLSE